MYTNNDISYDFIVNNEKITIHKSDIDCYRGYFYGCVIYIKSGSAIHVKESFNFVDNIFQLTN